MPPGTYTEHQQKQLLPYTAGNEQGQNKQEARSTPADVQIVRREQGQALLCIGLAPDVARTAQEIENLPGLSSHPCVIRPLEGYSAPVGHSQT